MGGYVPSKHLARVWFPGVACLFCLGGESHNISKVFLPFDEIFLLCNTITMNHTGDLRQMAVAAQTALKKRMREALTDIKDKDTAKSKSASDDLWCRIVAPGHWKPHTRCDGDECICRLVSYAHKVYTFADPFPFRHTQTLPNIILFSLHEDEFFVNWMGTGPNFSDTHLDTRSLWEHYADQGAWRGPYGELFRITLCNVPGPPPDSLLSFRPDT